jgi:hypothetical protein
MKRVWIGLAIFLALCLLVPGFVNQVANVVRDVLVWIGQQAQR